MSPGGASYIADGAAAAAAAAAAAVAAEAAWFAANRRYNYKILLVQRYDTSPTDPVFFL